MDVTALLPDVGVDVQLPDHVDLSIADDLSFAQLAYVTLFFQQQLATRAANPATFHDFAQYTLASGEDWSGFNGTPPPSQTENETSPHDEPPLKPTAEPAAEPENATTDRTALPSPPLPTPPENIWDTIPVVAEITRQLENSQEAVVTHFCRQIQPAFMSQPEYFGSPVGIVAYKNSTDYFKEVLRFSRTKTKQIHARQDYVTWKTGMNPNAAENDPKLPKVAGAFVNGTISGENLDRIIRMDDDLTKYTKKVGADLGYKDAALEAFKPTLVEAATSSNPDSLNTARKRWANTIAHHICADGPPLADAFRKQGDNILRDQAYADGSGKVWMHLTPPVFAEFKSFALEQLSNNGAPMKLDENLTKFLYGSDPEDEKPSGETTNSQSSTDQDSPSDEQATNVGEFDVEPLYDPNAVALDDLNIDHDPEATVAEDSEGHPITQEQMDHLERLSPGQRLGAIFVGIFHAMRKLPPGELAIKRAHGAASMIHIIQDIQTAYHTLGVGALPEKARRPRGPDGIIPPVIRLPNPETSQPDANPDPDRRGSSIPPPWTSFISEATNYGSIDPQDTEILACDSELVGQIWNKHHTVLDQRRTKRDFTRAQRRAILARDRGCQAPGCTIVAALCDIHHIEPWSHGGMTDLDNAICLCTYHHGQVHNGKWTIRTLDGVHYFQPAAWLDPYQPLLRNAQWAL